MLINPGDLIPVRSEAIHIPWTKRKSTILNFLHRGPVTFKTYVYDTNVGDISSLATYFNPERWTNKDLNTKFGHKPKTNLAQAVAEGGIYQSSSTSSPPPSGQDQDDSVSVLPRLLLYPYGEDGADIVGETTPKHKEQSSPETPPQTPPSSATGLTTPPTSQTTVVRNPPSQDEMKNEGGLEQVVKNKDQQTFEWIISQQSSDDNKTTETLVASATSSPSEDNSSNFEDVFSSSKTTKTSDFWPTSSMPIRNLSTDLFDGWNNGPQSNSKIPEIQRPSDVWRFGSTSSVNDSTLGGFWSWNPSSNTKTLTNSKNTRSESTSSSGSSTDEPNGGWMTQPSGRSGTMTASGDNGRLGSTGWSSTGPSSVHGSTESLTIASSSSAFRAFENEENFFLGESLLQNLTNFKTRNETLV